MAWEYLATPEFNLRALWLDECFLRGKRVIEGKGVLDLNCGHAPLAGTLAGRCSFYVGNDTRPLERHDGFLFYQTTDQRMVDIVLAPGFPPVRVLVVMGYYPYAKQPNEHESPTLEAALQRLADARLVETVVVECARAYEAEAAQAASLFGPPSRAGHLDLPWKGAPALAWLSRRSGFVVRVAWA